MEAERERAAIVAWLRMLEEGISTTLSAVDWSEKKRIELDTLSEAYARMAHAIERGAHHPKGDGQ